MRIYQMRRRDALARSSTWTAARVQGPAEPRARASSLAKVILQRAPFRLSACWVIFSQSHLR